MLYLTRRSTSRGCQAHSCAESRNRARRPRNIRDKCCGVSRAIRRFGFSEAKGLRPWNDTFRRRTLKRCMPWSFDATTLIYPSTLGTVSISSKFPQANYLLNIPSALFIYSFTSWAVAIPINLSIVYLSAKKNPTPPSLFEWQLYYSHIFAMLLLQSCALILASPTPQGPLEHINDLMRYCDNGNQAACNDPMLAGYYPPQNPNDTVDAAPANATPPVPQNT